MKYDELQDALNTFYSDTSRTRGQTKSGLLNLRDEIDVLVDTLEDAEETDDDQ